MDPFMFRHHGTDIDIQYESARDDWHQISREPEVINDVVYHIANFWQNASVV